MTTTLLTPSVLKYCRNNDNSRVTKKENYYVILDLGSIDNFFIDTAAVKNQTTEHTPIKVTLPDSTKLQSTHACTIDLLQIPHPANQGYILPRMKSHSLISVTKLCKAGCTVSFGERDCIVSKNGNDLIRGTKNTTNGLWYIPQAACCILGTSD